MTILEYINHLHSLGIELSLENGQLKVSAPKGILTDALAAEMRQRKQEIISFLQEAQSRYISTPPHIPLAARTDPIPLSSSQKSIWFIDQLAPGLTGYNLSTLYMVSGLLDIPALTAAFTEILNRHEILRTVFVLQGDGPVQKICPPGPACVEFIDISNTAASDRDAVAFAHLQKQSQTPFDCANGPLYRITIIRKSDQEHLLFWMAHHSIWDGWSFTVLLNELSALYSAFVNKQASPLPLPPIQYADFAVWQQEWLKSAEYQKELAYWKEQLSGDLPALQLPQDCPRPAQMSHNGNFVHFNLEKQHVDTLKAIAINEGTTLFSLLITAYIVLLHRYSQQNDIIVGFPCWGRTHPDLENLLGYFVNTVVIRSDLSGDPSFRELLAKTTNRLLEVQAHQKVPFDQLVCELNPPRDTGRTPVYQAFFGYHEEGDLPSKLGDLAMQQLPEPETVSAPTDILLWFTKTKTELQAGLGYNSDIFDRSAMENLAENFRTLLCGIMANPDERISKLPVVCDAEKQLLTMWNNTKQPIPNNFGLHTFFEAQARRVPNNIAIRFGNESLTYKQLDDRACRLCSYLLSLGAGPNLLIGIAVERSFDMVAAMLAILKTGAAYVPIDPNYPSERIAYMIKNSKLTIIVSQDSVKAKLPPSPARIVSMDGDAAGIAAQPPAAPVLFIAPQSPAYVIYTSGSTGLPKGVIIPHCAVVNFIQSMQKEPGITERDNVVAITTLSFDIAVLELFLPLSVGASIILADRNTAMDAEKIKTLLHNENPTIMQATPSTWRLLLSADWKGLANLTVLCGGEAFPQDLIEPLLSRSKIVWNMYGPTETTVWSTCFQITSSSAPMRIGRPIANTQIHIVNKSVELVPIGVIGELCIAGAGVALGYLDRPDLTQKAFIPNPFGKGLLYKTGDLARFHNDGTIECLGRIDNQVKIRGFRIELGEIESVASSHPAVRQCIAHVDGSGDDVRLVLYFIRNTGLAVTAEDLRKHLKTDLPDYMAPQHFVEVENFALTPSGKIDRNALPAIDASSRIKTNGTPPQTSEELVLAEIWKKLLKTASVNREDNFFELGGHSLLAVQLFFQIQKSTGINLPLATLFAAPTLQGLAAVIAENLAIIGTNSTQNKNVWRFVVPIKPSGTNFPFFCVHGVGGNVLNYKHFVPHLDINQPLYGLQCRGIDGISPLFNSIEEMARHYVADIRSIQPHGPYFLGGGSMGGLVAFEMAQQLLKVNEPVSMLLMLDSACPKLLKNIPDKKIHNSNLFAQVWHSIKCRIRDTFKYAKCARYQLLRIPIPHELRYWRITQKNLALAGQYLPEPYSRLITMFRAKQNNTCSNPYRGWQSVAKGGMEFFDFNCPHTTMTEDSEVGKKVGEVLNKNIKWHIPTTA